MKNIYLSNDKKLLGICAGLAEYLNVDPTLIRIGVVSVALITAVLPALAVYLVLGLVFSRPPEGYVPQEPAKRLYKGRDKKLSGVCSGLAEYFGLDATIVRLIFAIAFLVFGYGLTLYIICLIMMPQNPVQVITGTNYENN